ncbi:MAG: hypothetical protein ACYCV4_17275 [Dermatophilaceae bacterium]
MVDVGVAVDVAVDVGVAADVVVATALGAGLWGDPPAPGRMTAHVMAQIAAMNRRAPAASRTGLGRRRP